MSERPIRLAYRVAEVASMTGLASETVRRAIERGDLAAMDRNADIPLGLGA